MADGLEYIGGVWEGIRSQYDRLLPAVMPEDLRTDEKAQDAIREARHALHEALSHLADVSVRLHKDDK